MRTPAQIIRDYRNGRKGFTLVEVIIASSLFSIVSLIGVGIFINVIRIQRRIYLENAIYEDGRFLMERLAREVRQNAIDYEEYYNKAVEGAAYGAEYGCYATRFYNPGSGGAGSNGFGAWCSVPPGGNPKTYPGCIINKTTLDINTGQNPYIGIPAPNNTAEAANAMCNGHYGVESDCSTNFAYYDRSELYLIDAAGKQKTLFVRKKVNDVPEYSVAMLRLQGADLNDDDVVEKWYDPSGPNYYCAPLFDCNGIASLESTIDGSAPGLLYKGFVPISPLRTTITSIHFFVSPLEDPRKAFSETATDLGVQQQPHVTIVMTLQPAASELTGYATTPPSITLQTTVSSRVYNEVKSYPGDGICSSY
jgi:prepilin-type N-terminal cleavage/methylation domain-containing protein